MNQHRKRMDTRRAEFEKERRKTQAFFRAWYLFLFLLAMGVLGGAIYTVIKVMTYFGIF